jgi:hypothetical protein
VCGGPAPYGRSQINAAPIVAIFLSR